MPKKTVQLLTCVIPTVGGTAAHLLLQSKVVALVNNNIVCAEIFRIQKSSSKPKF